MAGFLDRLGQGAARHKWVTIGVWLLLAVVLVVAAEASGGTTVDVFKIPGAQSEKARELLQQRFPAQSGDTADVAFQARNGTITDPANQAAIAEAEANLQPGKVPDVTQVTGPATPIVGSAFVQRMLAAADPAAGVTAVRDLAAELAAGVRGVRGGAAGAAV